MRLRTLVLAGVMAVSAAALMPSLAAAQGQPPNPNAQRPFTYDPGNYATAEAHYDALRQQAGSNLMQSPGFDQLPDWTGLWTRDIGAEGFSTRPHEKFTGVGLQTEIQMKLTPKYQARYDQMVQDFKAGKGDWDPLSYCLPAGYPRWHVEPFLKEFFVRPEMSLLINEQQSEVRRIFTDGRGHTPADQAYPLWDGDAIGFWRVTGDQDKDKTLVIWTNQLKAGIYQRQQPEHSDKVETVEEWTEIDPGVMEVRMTIYDPEALQEPFPLIRYYYRIDDQNGDLRVRTWTCAENNNVVITADHNSDFILPGEEGYKTPVGAAATPEALDPAKEGQGNR